MKALGLLPEIKDLASYNRVFEYGRADLRSHFENGRSSPEIRAGDWEDFHGQLFGHLHNHAGTFREGDKDVMVHGREAPHPIEIGIHLEALEELQIDRIHPGSIQECLEVIGEVHCRFLATAPFEGITNEIVAREVLDYQLKATFGYLDWSAPDWERYEQAVKLGVSQQDYSTMTELLGDVLVAAISNELDQDPEIPRFTEEEVARWRDEHRKTLEESPKLDHEELEAHSPKKDPPADFQIADPQNEPVDLSRARFPKGEKEVDLKTGKLPKAPEEIVAKSRAQEALDKVAKERARINEKMIKRNKPKL